MTARTFAKMAAMAAWTLLACVALTANGEATTTVANISPSFGTTGTTVTIYGTNFGTTTGTVTFYNNKLATISSWTTTAIKVTVPSTATTGIVTVQPYHGTKTQSTADFVVLPTDGMLVMGAFPPQFSNCSLLPQPGNDCITQYQSDVIPHVDGIVIQASWSSVDLGNNGNSTSTSPGCTSGASSSTCDWSALDSLVTTYAGQTGWDGSKKVGIVLSPVTNGSGVNGINTSTPSYVFTSTWATTAGGSGTNPLDECTCSGYQGDSGAPTHNGCWSQANGGSTDTSGMPVVWEAPFKVALQDFYNAVVSHFSNASYAPSYAPYIAYIRMGLSTGGEEYPHCSSSMETYFTINDTQLETDWTTYANSMFTYEGGLGSQQPLMAAPNGNGTNSGVPSDSWADTEASDAVAQGLQMGSEGLQSNDTFDTNCSVSGGSSNDWCYTFNHYTPTKIRELQTLGYSDPSENVCTTDYFMAGNSDSQNTASILCLLPFAEGKANSVELYPNDMFTAFDSNDTLYSTYGSAYSGCIANARAGSSGSPCN
jgi:IPT/TIG domain